jgi:hypothetical protein
MKLPHAIELPGVRVSVGEFAEDYCDLCTFEALEKLKPGQSVRLLKEDDFIDGAFFNESLLCSGCEDLFKFPGERDCPRIDYYAMRFKMPPQELLRLLEEGRVKRVEMADGPHFTRAAVSRWLKRREA